MRIHYWPDGHPDKPWCLTNDDDKPLFRYATQEEAQEFIDDALYGRLRERYQRETGKE